MTRPTVLDMDLVVVPREATDEMLHHFTAKNDEAVKRGWYGLHPLQAHHAMLSASPYPTAWDDVRKYVEKLEVEAKCDEEYLDLVRDKYRAVEARIAELEKRLADAEMVIEPFAECASEWDGEPDSLHVFLEWNDERKPVPSLPVADFRAARAYMEGK